eukprot:CAMPEP_0170081800 /NCGR_PEP_ID=MMETSP0019_2-20121128/17569_1 /TAXON_ID=98059 /ORGANISM="Dinobryon sp., Strain UTEXLB2267" /LENGTH=103 /DNA_ID=CAMNT_0010296395 /DNA_START=250 /DNA_END=561 /DNA_ORIENTATION=+
MGFRVVEGSGVGLPLGCLVGGFEGNAIGTAVNFKEGNLEGAIVIGRMEGSLVGIAEVFFDGSFESIAVGEEDGTAVGSFDGGFEGLWLEGDNNRASNGFTFES